MMYSTAVRRAVRGLFSTGSCAPVAARRYLWRPSSAAVSDGHSGAVHDRKTGNAFATDAAAAADGRRGTTRSSAEVAPPGPSVAVNGFGRVLGAVRGVTAFNRCAGPARAAPARPTDAACHVPPRPSVAVNGFGRVGKCLLRLAAKNNVNVVAVNEPYVDVKSMARTFREDPVHGKFRGQVEVENKDNLCVNEKLIKVYHEEDPEKIKWGEMKVDYVIDSSGKFTNIAAATKHISPGGAKKVVVVAPSKDAPTFFKGVNYHDYKKTVLVVSTGSSTASCVAPLLHAINEKFRVVGYMVSSAPVMMPDRFFLDAMDCGTRNKNNGCESDYGSTVFRSMPELHSTSEGLCFLKLYMSLKTTVNTNDIKCLIWKMSTSSDDSAVSYRQNLGKFVFSAKHPISRYSAVVDFNYVHVNGKHVTIAMWYDNATGRAARALDLVEHMTKVDHSQK